MSSCKDVLGALQKRCGFTLEMKEALIGGVAIDEKGDPFPDESLEQCLKSDSVLLSCIGGYKVRGSSAVDNLSCQLEFCSLSSYYYLIVGLESS